jgi:hypothetical protein
MCHTFCVYFIVNVSCRQKRREQETIEISEECIARVENHDQGGFVINLQMHCPRGKS